MTLRNVPWDHDELVLAMHLYRRIEGWKPATHPDVCDLSRELVEAHTDPRGYHKGDRSPDAVSMRLGCFAFHDPTSRQKGRDGGSRELQQVWYAFKDDVQALAVEARNIRARKLTGGMR